MRDIQINVGQLVIFFILGLGILPATSLAGIALPMQYTLLPIFALIVMLIFMKKYNVPIKSKKFIFLWTLIVVHVIFTGTFSPMLELNSFNLPTESANFIARFLFFCTFIILFYNYRIKLKTFMGVFIFVLCLGMFIAVFQFFNWAGSDFFRSAYSTTEHLLNQMYLDNPASRRVSGMANFATATGGIAAFLGIMVLSMHFFYRKRRLLTIIGLSLAFFNVVVAQARMGYLTVAFSLILLFFVYNIVYKNGFKFIKSTFGFVSITAIASALIYWLYQSGNSFVTQAVYRWEALGQQIDAGGNRVGQIEPALAQIDHPFNFLFGISRGVQETLGGVHMEIEPLSIFVLYGAVGFVLIYSLSAMLLYYFYKNMKLVKGKPILLAMTVASFVGLLSYLFFSGAYWFWREVYVGLYPWILMGATIGAIERFKKYPDDFDKEQGVPKAKEKKKRKKYKIVW